MRAWLDRNGELMLATAIYLALAISLFVLAAVAVTILASSPANSATCTSRPGMSRGAVWWRWYYRDDGARCWYPGRRYAHRPHRARYAALRFRPKIKPPQIRWEKLTAAMGRPGEQTPGELARRTDSFPVPPATRSVRIVPITNGFTPVERVERGFNKLIMFPVEDEP